MADFIKGGDRSIENRRRHLCVELGGNGIIDMNVLNTSMKCAWLKRWKNETNFTDYPKILVLGDGNRVNMEGVMGRQEGSYRLLDDIMAKWRTFKKEYYRMGNNREDLLLFGNDTFYGRGVGMEREVFGMGRYRELEDRIKELRWKDITSMQGFLRDYVEINAEYNVDINWGEYFRLRNALAAIKVELGEKIDEEESMELDDWIEEQKKKGCKKFRKVLTGRRSRQYQENDPRQIASGITLWGNIVAGMNRTRIELNFSVWNIMCLEPHFKDFLFRLVQGKLYLNQIVAHFADRRPQCTFCVMDEIKEMRRLNVVEEGADWNRRINGLRHESVNHLFWGCEYVRRVIDGIGNRLAGSGGRVFGKDAFFGGIDDISIGNMQMCILIVHFIKFYIYSCKLRRRMPTVPQGIYEIEGMFRILGRRERWQEQVEDVRELTYRMMRDVDV